MQADEPPAPSHRSGRQHVRQGNDYQNGTGMEGSYMLAGKEYRRADIFLPHFSDQSHDPQKTEQEKQEDFSNNLRFSRSQLDQGHATATPIVPLTSRSPSLVRRPSSTVPLNINDGHTTLDSVIDPRILLPAEPFLDTHPQDETAIQAQVDKLVRQTYGVGQAHIRDDSASAGHSANRAKSQYFAKQNDEYAIPVVAHREGITKSAPAEFPRDSRGLSPHFSAASARTFGCQEPGCPKRFKTQANLMHHAATHDWDKKTAHKCDVCGRGFRYPKDVERHFSAIHAPIGSSVQCPACGNHFSRQYHVDRHLLTCPIALSAAEPRQKCTFCSEDFRFLTDLERHRLEKHASQDSGFQCEGCGKLFSRHENLDRHRTSMCQIYASLQPAPSPSTNTLFSAGAQGPPNPFARPAPPMSTNPHAANRETIETPMTALPSRFMQEMLPSPSTFYSELRFGRFNDSNMLPSPLNFQTPVVGNVQGWREEDRKRAAEEEAPNSNGGHQSPPSVSSVASDDSSPKSGSSLAAGENAFTDAVTTAPSANVQKADTSHSGLTATDDFDAATQGLPENEQREYASAFVRSLREAVEIPPDQAAILATSRDMVADLFQTYAAMFIPHLDAQHYGAVKFVHRQRKLISDLLHNPEYMSPAQSTTDGGEQIQKERFPEAESRLRIEAWLQSISEGFETAKLHAEVDPYAAEEPDSYMSGAQVSLIDDSGAFLRSGLPWQWLTTRLSSLVRLSWPDGGLEDEVSRTVMAAMTTANWAASNVQTVSCCVDWDPASFLSTQYDQNFLPRLGEVITLTGWDNQVQSMTCSEYIQQTWPIYGMSILYAVEDAIGTSAATAHRALEDDLSIDVHLLGPKTIIRINGQISLLPQIVAQIAWLGAACRVSPDPDSNCFTTAHVETSSSPAAVATLSIQYSFDLKPPPQTSGCWFSFGCYASIASGFPIAARRQGEEGLELGLELMATLAWANYATCFRDKFLLKGFASMLIPIQKIGQSILWHFVHDSNGGFLPYTASDAFACNTRVGIESLNRNRHFVGWVPASDVHFDMNLSGVRQPSRLETGSGVTLEKASVSGGRFISAGLAFGLGNHLKPLWRDLPTCYAKAIGEARQWPIVLYDTDTRRAWLEDGASALLQITLGQIWADKFVKLHQLASIPDVDLACKSHKGGDEAMSILLNQKNHLLQLYQEASAPEVKRNWNEQGGFLGERPEQVLTVWGFRDQVQENFELLAKMSSHQREPTPGVRMRFSGRERLEGWSFKDVIDERTLLERKTVHLEPSGQGWEPLAREINALVLMGGGFGDVITPSPQVPTCCIWNSVPQGQDFLVTTYDYLKEIAEGKRADDFPRHLTPTILWHQPDALFQGPCNTGGTRPAHSENSASGCGRIQVLLTSKLLEKLRAGSRSFLKSPKGKDAAESSSSAVIFGRPRRKWLPGDPMIMSSTPLLSEPNAARPRRIRSTTSTKNPLPVFTSLLSADNANNQSTSSSGNSRLTSSAEGSNTRISSQATSILPAQFSEDEPVLTQRSKKRKADVPASPTTSSSDISSTHTQDGTNVTSKLPIREKTRISRSGFRTEDTARSDSNDSHAASEDMLGESEPSVPRHSERLRTANRHQSVVEPMDLDDAPMSKKRRTSTMPGLRSSKRHLGEQGDLREAYDTQAD